MDIATVSTGTCLSCRLARRNCSIRHAYGLMSSLPSICDSLLVSQPVVRHGTSPLRKCGEFRNSKRPTCSYFMFFRISYFRLLCSLFLSGFIHLLRFHLRNRTDWCSGNAVCFCSRGLVRILARLSAVLTRVHFPAHCRDGGSTRPLLLVWSSFSINHLSVILPFDAVE